MTHQRAKELRAEWEASQARVRMEDRAGFAANLRRDFQTEPTQAERRMLARMVTSKRGANLDRVAVESPQYRAAWGQLIRGRREDSLPYQQREALRAGEYRDLALNTNSAGGYVVPPAFWADLTQALRANDAIRNISLNVETPDGTTLRKPVVDDTSTPATFFPPASENTQINVTDPTFSALSLHAFPFGAIERVPYTLLSDADGKMTVTHTPANNGPNYGKGGSVVRVGDRLDAEVFLAEMFGFRIARAQAPYFATGTGTNQPQGITAATVGATTAANNALAFADLNAVWNSLDPVYKPSATWVMAPGTAQLVRAIQDSSSRVIFDPTKDLTIFGRPVVESPDMSAFGAGAANVIVVGDFQRGFVVRDTPAVTQVLHERYTDYLEVGVLLVQRTDSAINDSRALRGLSVHA